MINLGRRHFRPSLALGPLPSLCAGLGCLSASETVGEACIWTMGPRPPRRLRLQHTLAALAPDHCAVTPERAKQLNQEAKAGSRTSVCWGLKDGEGSDSATLTADDVAFFGANGFLLKKGLLDLQACESACDYIWKRAPSFLKKDDPTTWLDPQTKWTPTKGRTGSSFNGGASWKMHDCGDAPWMLELYGANPRVLAHVQGLVGGEVRPPTRTRGVYSVWPSSKHRELDDAGIAAAMGPHNDGSAQVLNGMAYLDTVGERGGGFTIWPGAHRLMYYAYGHQFNPGRDPELYNALMAQVKRTITPLEICAPRGSVVFWHGRMAHSAGIHKGLAGSGPRFAVPTDWQRLRPNGVQMEWFKDAPVYVDFNDELGGPKADMFADWAMVPEAMPEEARSIDLTWEEGEGEEVEEEEEGVIASGGGR